MHYECCGYKPNGKCNVLSACLFYKFIPNILCDLYCYLHAFTVGRGPNNEMAKIKHLEGFDIFKHNEREDY